MDLRLSEEDLAFRDEVRAFLDENLTDEIREAARLTPGVRGPYRESRDWASRLARRGWLAYSWPVEYGGPGWSAVQRYIFELECATAGTPVLNTMGTRMVGPVIMKFGTRAQKDDYLPRIRGDALFWCQGYSEPGSGSDLASLQTRAVADGGDYVIYGSKIWTTAAHLADHIFCLVRTSTAGKPQEGISFLVFPMDLPGITVKPVLMFSGEHELNQVFFDDVRVAQANRIGAENQGWTVAKYLLEFERGGNAYTPPVKAGLARLKHIGAVESAGGGALFDDTGFRRKLAELEIRVAAAEMTEKRVMSALSQGQNPGAAASIFKLGGSVLLQEMLELTMQAIGPYAAVYQPEAYATGANVAPIAPAHGVTAAARYYNQRAATIYAGSSEVQRNIIAKAVLGL